MGKTLSWGILNVLLLVIIIGVIFFVLPAISRFGGSFAAARTITVSAQGMTTATPDEAVVDFSVVSQGANPQTLSDTNNSKMSAVLQFVSSQGIAASDTATTAYNLAPDYQFDMTTQRNFITGYTLTQTVEVKIRDLTKVASVLAGLAPLGVNQVGGVNFTFQDPNEFVGIARADAISKAEQQASMMASQAGVSLGQIMSVGESSNVPFPQPVFAEASGASTGMAVAPSVPTIEPGTQDVTDNVTITYALK